MRFVIVSGLPASGKSTLARALSDPLDLIVFDKDQFLERLFAERGTGDAAWRTALSREADHQFERAALQAAGALLVSWWRHPLAPATSGTPTAWLTALPGTRIELHCECDPGVAAMRFMQRTRHHGHLDASRTVGDVHDEFLGHAARGALGVGPLVSVRCDQPVDVAETAAAVRAAFSARAR